MPHCPKWRKKFRTIQENNPTPRRGVKTKE